LKHKIVLPPPPPHGRYLENRQVNPYKELDISSCNDMKIIMHLHTSAWAWV